MKNKALRVLYLVLAVLTVFNALSLPMLAYASADKVTSTREDITVTTGSSAGSNYFKEDTYYDLPKLDTTPLTYEFELSVPKSIGGAGVYGGVILGNYGKDGTRCISIEIHEYGAVRFYTNTSSGNVDIKFSKTNFDVRKGTNIHLAIAIDVSAGTATLYANGALVDTKTNSNLKNLPKASDFPFNFRVGGDHRSGNERHYEGTIDSIALYSDLRTAEEIAADASRSKSWSAGTDGLIAAYDITKQGETALKDYSGNGNTLTYTNGSGALLKNFGTYKVENKLEAAPETLEAWVFFPKFYSARGGTIFANDDNDRSNSADLSFEIENDGHPRFFYTTATGSVAYHEFGDVNVRSGSWTHVVMVHDAANSEARCYINGALAQTLAYTETTEVANVGTQSPVAAYHAGITNTAYVLGGTNQKGNPQYFKGFLKEVRVYSDVRTAEEIASDYSGAVDITEAGLLAYYQPTEAGVASGVIEDLSERGYTAVLNQLMYDTTEPITDYAYSLAVVGDTQTITNHNSAKLKDLYQWIVNNVDARNIQYVIGLGDITERGDKNGSTYAGDETARKQWQAALDAIKLMDGKVPYSLIRGAGHDGLDYFNEYFASHAGYTKNIAGYYTEGSVENVYHTFTVGAYDYLILCLEFGAKDDVLAWADSVVEAHPTHRVIVTTHGYLEKDGSFLEGSETFSPSRYDPDSNDGDDIWDKFVRKHSNIFMVMSGHMSANDVVVSEMVGDNGNTVKQLLVDPQSMDSSSSLKGMVAMLYFSEDGEQVQVEYYSTLTNTWRPKTGFEISYAQLYDTPYGNIPAEYEDVSANPILLFNTDTKQVVRSFAQLHADAGAVKYCADNDGNYAILVRKDKMSTYSSTTIGSLSGKLILDLGGNTIYAKGAFLEFQGKDSSTTVVSVINGTVDMSNSSAAFIGVGGKYGNGKKTNTVTVENVTFKSLSKKLVYETYGCDVNTTSTITFKNCRFEMPAAKTDRLIALGAHSDKTRITTVFEGGEFVFAGTACDIFTTGVVARKYVYFAKGESGAYPTVTKPTDGVINDTLTTPDGAVLGFYKLSESAGAVKYQLAPFSIAGAYLNLTENVNVCYTVVLPAGYTDAYMVFEFNGKTYEVTESALKDGKTVFSFKGLTPEKLGDNIKATLYATYGGSSVSVEKAEYSVKQYCDLAVKYYPDDTALLTLVSDLLVYGEKTQLFAGYKTDALVTDGVEWLAPSAFTPPESDLAINGDNDGAYSWRGAGLNLTSEMNMYVYFTAESVEGLSVKFAINGREYTYDVSTLAPTADGRYKIYFHSIHAYEFDDAVTASFIKDGATVGATLTYSVDSYIDYMQDSDNAALAELVKAISAYGRSADAYK